MAPVCGSWGENGLLVPFVPVGEKVPLYARWRVSAADRTVVRRVGRANRMKLRQGGYFL